MITDSEIHKIIKHIEKNVNLNLPLPEEYYYAHLPCCVIDAVFSIGARYSSTRNVTIRYCNHLELKRIRNNRNQEYPERKNQNSVSELLKLFKNNSIDYITQYIFQNRQKTSSQNGILKSKAVQLFAQALIESRVDYFQDLHLIQNNIEFSRKIKDIPGQRSGISLKYFLMLSGNESLVKPDRMLRRFLADALNKKENTISDSSIQATVSKIFEKKIFDNVESIRHLDYLIWNYQSQE